MSLEISKSVRWIASGALLGALGFFVFEFLFVLLVVYGLASAAAIQDPSQLGSSVAGALGLLACSAGGWFCLRRRRFLMAFGRWSHAENEEPGVERRAMRNAAHDAFMRADFPRASTLLEKYLAERPADGNARANLSCALIMSDEIPAGLEQLKVAGDPRGLAPLLEAGPAWKRLLFWSAPFKAGEPGELVRGLPLALVLVGGFGFAALLAFNERAKLDQLTARFQGLKDSDFKRKESRRFIYYYHEEDFQRTAAEAIEAALDYNLDFFGLPADKFDTSKLKVYLCSDKREYLTRSPVAKDWEGGVAYPAERKIILYRDAPRLTTAFHVVVAHELSHLCYEQVVSGSEEDSWLNEGLADYVAYFYVTGKFGIPTVAWLKENQFKDVAARPLPFKLFLSHRPQELRTREDVHQFYRQGFSLVFVLIQYYGKPAFFAAIRDFSRTKDLEGALKRSYPTIASIDDLQGIWSLFMKDPKASRTD